MSEPKPSAFPFSTSALTAVDQDRFGRRPLIERFVKAVEAMPADKKLLGLFAPWGSGKTSALNMCIEQGNKLSENDSSRPKPCHWLKPFETWRYERVGLLELSLLWHLQEEFPQGLSEDKKAGILQSVKHLAKVVTVATANAAGKSIGIDGLGTQAVALLEATASGDPRASALASCPDFAKYELLKATSKAFDDLGERLCESFNCDRVVVPIDDMERCSPEAGTNLLFSLKHLLVSKRFTFVVAVDRSAMGRFLSLHYGQTLNDEDSQWFLEKVFDDWTELPQADFKEQLFALVREFDFVNHQSDLCASFQSGPLAKIPRNPRKLVRAFERFLKMFKLKIGLRAASLMDMQFKLAIFMLHAEHPLLVDTLLAGVSASRIAKKTDHMHLISLCKKYHSELLADQSVRSMMGNSTPVPKPALERWSSRLPFVLIRHTQDINGGFSHFLVWLNEDEEGKKMTPEDFDRCLLDVQDCL